MSSTTIDPADAAVAANQTRAAEQARAEEAGRAGHVPAPFHTPGSPEYTEATAAYQLAVPVDPLGAFTARTVDDVVRAVVAARQAGVRLQVHTTGHAAGRAAPFAGSLLLRPLLQGPVVVDPLTRTARIPAGTTWGDVLAASTVHGLTALHGSSSDVGVVGYLLGGGLSFYGRRFGLAANHIRSITIVLADGQVRTVSAAQDPDLFWALRGGGGGFGVVTEVEIDLISVHAIVTGMAVWDAEDGEDAARVAAAWQDWARTAPRSISTSLRILSLPPRAMLPPVLPAVLAGRRVLALDGAAVAADEPDLPAAEAVVAGMLEQLNAVAAPRSNTWAVAPPQALPLTHLDPPQPVAFTSDTALVDELDPAEWADLLAAAPNLLALELRQLGGAMAEPARGGGSGSSNGGGGALDHFDAPLQYYAVGMDTPETVVQLRTARNVLSPRLTGRTAPNFVDHVGQLQRSVDDDVRTRVQDVRVRVDPDGLFGGDVAPFLDTHPTGTDA